MQEKATLFLHLNSARCRPCILPAEPALLLRVQTQTEETAANTQCLARPSLHSGRYTDDPGWGRGGAITERASAPKDVRLPLTLSTTQGWAAAQEDALAPPSDHGARLGSLSKLRHG